MDERSGIWGLRFFFTAVLRYGSRKGGSYRADSPEEDASLDTPSNPIYIKKIAKIRKVIDTKFFFRKIILL